MPGEQKKVCIDVPYIDQSKLYPTGCESVSTVMLLRFLGIDITVSTQITPSHPNTLTQTTRSVSS